MNAYIMLMKYITGNIFKFWVKEVKIRRYSVGNISVTELGDFSMFKVTKLRAKVAKILSGYLGYFKEHQI